ncbi:MAG: dihydroorotate dehydrogenase (quinone) [Phenylobacterium sp. RIFCSPHIGHO2_01_FULL_69_31]|uniref:quinone-dependent dihydroorotate dehydrogenase n=1 Tax=Phenylobacterium sp. RIFCSPHIGHO2_01_FULL_69_31 TaxID=1801944 RepID=UPI0008C40E14|nr:quinone-dependent dihydroorotate dehydrogenase [Phenylobacterium sp. RIFCSPHIGHO2_01_FULL_69_31]OHB30653.1 MAG: dihydroorotate dehydrogenase (quinone) [Phenylobacterium sp. RIFCSPHIGHO2_01_FULL_69_31]
MKDLHGLATYALRNLDPEDAHTLAIKGLKLGLGPRAPADDPILATDLAGLTLPNPVGLAPGFDKNAEVFGPMLRAGFGFVECGTVTPLPQAGNPRPRLFRLWQDRAVINRMGFNNEGLEPFAARLAHRGRGVVGANLGANKDSEDRLADYTTGLRRLWGMASYFTINISSPNTPGLRALQTKASLDELLGRLMDTADSLPQGVAVPMFLKVAPDLEDAEIEAIADSVADHGLAGVIVSNTTISRPPLKSRHRDEPGGLSGAPLTALSTRVLGQFREAGAGRFLLIGAGGIASGADAYAKLRAGAAAVQLYSALAYEGPGLVVRIKRDLAARLRADGFGSVAEAVGAR